MSEAKAPYRNLYPKSVEVDQDIFSEEGGFLKAINISITINQAPTNPDEVREALQEAFRQILELYR